MPENKFTPGPWQTSLSDDTVVIHVGADGVHYEVASIDGDYNEPDLWPVMEANARLIAAAPDLLEACQALLASHRPGTGQCCKASDLGIAAIAKATSVIDVSLTPEQMA